MISSRCQMPPPASPDHVQREPGRWHWLGRTFKQSHPSLSPRLILGEETKLLPAVTLRDSSQSHSQAETWLGPRGRQSWPLLYQEPLPPGRSPALPGAPSAKALVAGVGLPTGGFVSLPFHGLQVFCAGPNLRSLPPPLSTPPCPGHAHPASPWPPPHPCWQGQGPRGDWLCGLGPIKVCGSDF
ncbi:Hypothetical predicted protein [Marmota monax]|uniref:Uncharacterized protein n=1 Tax=Marmota monax TaxID=9995 RepID=A0A5E4AYR1_MARMO|nr:Hypothetical predicted protein [Marmota monax]